MKNITKRQEEVLQVLVQFQNNNGYPPTSQEISHLMGMSSPNAAAEHLKALERKGVITITKHKARGIQIIGGQTPAQQRDEAIAALRDLFACNVGAAERAAALIKRYDSEGGVA